MRPIDLVVALAASVAAFACTVQSSSSREAPTHEQEAPKAGEATDPGQPDEAAQGEPAEGAGEPPREEAAQQARASEPPSQEQIDELRPLLFARHPRDLPDRDTLAAHPNAEATLIHLADNDDRMIVRERALLLLGHFATSSAEEFLTAAASEPERDPRLRAAAIAGLGKYDLEGRADLREAVIAQLEHADLRVGFAAVQALRDVPSAAAALKRAADNPDVPDRVRAAAGEAVAALEAD
jgi:hypothetical protein